MRILCTNDDPSTLSVLLSLLRSEGHFVETALSNEEAERKLAAGAFDVLITDLIHPDRDGDNPTGVSGIDEHDPEFDSYEGVRLIDLAKKENPEIRCVALTYTPFKEKIAARTHAYLNCPFKVDQLIAALK